MSDPSERFTGHDSSELLAISIAYGIASKRRKVSDDDQAIRAAIRNRQVLALKQFQIICDEIKNCRKHD